MAPTKCDIKGVNYEKGYLQVMDQVTAKMAGALGFNNTVQLWDLYLKDPSTRAILSAWLDIRRRTFGAQLKHSHMTLRPAIVKGPQAGCAVCVPIDRDNLLRHLMEIDHFQHDCILSEGSLDGVQYPSVLGSSGEATTAPTNARLKLEYILENPTMVGPDIPPCSITTVELPNVEPTVYTSVDPGDGSHSHRCTLRRLCLLSFSTRLDMFVPRINARHDLTDQLRDIGPKRGHAIHSSSPGIPSSHGYPQAQISPRKGAFNTTATDRPRFIILAHWPLVLWLTEMFLNSLSIQFVTIRPSMSAKDRRKAITLFNSPKRPCQILLTNFNCGTKSLNLHTLCSRMVVMEPPLDLKRLLHAIGSIHRVGQKARQKVWMLFQDQYLQSLG
ncbi:hypothetical protein BJX76DRAFT_355220 [Aspergillus varians]